MTASAITYFAILGMTLYIVLLLIFFRLGNILDELRKIWRRLNE